MVESEEVHGLQFKWGEKRGTALDNKDVQFYESFTYNGCEYWLYDCVSVDDNSNPDSHDFFVGKIIKIWEYIDQRRNPRRIELLWFFKPCDLSLHLHGVQDVLDNELFLASGTGVGLTNENQLEVISGKCHVICISKDVRNPQPSDEEIKSADFLFHRTFDVGTSKILDKIEDQIAGVDVTFIFNRTSCEKEASAVQKLLTDIQRIAASLKPNQPSTSGSVGQNERNAGDCDYGYTKEQDNESHKQLAWENTTLAEERPNKDYGYMEEQDNESHKQLARKNSTLAEERSNKDYAYMEEQDNEFHKQLARKNSTLAEERSNKDSGRGNVELGRFSASGSRWNDFHGRKDHDDEVEKHLAKQKSRLAEEKCSKDSYCLDDMLRKKRRLDGSIAVSDGSTKGPQKMRNDGRRDIELIGRDAMVEKSRLAEVRRSKDSYGLDDMSQKKRRLDDSVAVSDGRSKEPQKIRNDSRKDMEPSRRDAMVEQSRFAEIRRSKDSYGLDDTPQKKRRVDDSVAVSDGRTRESQNISHDGRKDIQRMRKDVMVEKSRLAGERCSKDSYYRDYMPQKKLELNRSAVVSDGRTKISQKISHDGRADPRDKVSRREVYSQMPSFTDKNQGLRIPKFSEGRGTRPPRFPEGRPPRIPEGRPPRIPEGRPPRFPERKEIKPPRSSEEKETRPATEKGIIKNSSPDRKISRHTEEKMLTNADYRRHYRVSEVTQKPNVEGSKWFRKLTWEESLRCAEGKGTLVLLRNLDPSYTSDEVENIVYSALNERCTARMIERTSATIPHIGEALVIFETMDAAKRAIRRLDEGCLLLSNGRILVATSAKVNAPAMPPLQFTGHIKFREVRRGKKSTAVTSHCAQGNTIEFEMAMDWCLHRDTYELTWKRIYERQIEENKKLELDVDPKHA